MRLTEFFTLVYLWYIGATGSLKCSIFDNVVHVSFKYLLHFSLKFELYKIKNIFEEKVILILTCLFLELAFDFQKLPLHLRVLQIQYIRILKLLLGKLPAEYPVTLSLAIFIFTTLAI